MRKVLFVISFVLLLPASIIAQELNCLVSVVITSTTQTVDKRIYETLEERVFEFMNNRRWTNKSFGAYEKIECNLLINVTQELGPNKFQAKVNISSTRPVFNSNYFSSLLSHADQDWTFNFTEFEPLEFNDNMHLNNLTSLLAYYAYMIIGLDFDSYSLRGGTPYYSKAQGIVNAAQNSGESGWRSLESQRNRFWLVENLLTKRFSAVRVVLYEYHRKGLDIMNKDIAQGRKVIYEGLTALLRMNREYPNSMILQVFFNAKADELANIFSGAPPGEKAKALKILNLLDPSRSSIYERKLK